jgi:3-deoxy-manno-octulosonate cytidylyltransferase (CMP-KDO synthetase)
MPADVARSDRPSPFDRSGSVVAVIPARFSSSRLPGKPLLSETGRPLIQHVVEAAGRSRRLDRVIVATDDARILDAVQRFGGEAVLTRSDHPSGTDRVAEVASWLPDCRIVVNLQGDEPEIEPEALDRVVELLDADPSAPMATICTPIRDRQTYLDPACVKVVRSSTGRALYFSRRPIPCHRDGEPDPEVSPLGFLHLGVYAYRRDFLLRLAQLPPSPLELSERLEQLRVLELGEPIAVDVVPAAPAGIDTPEDYRSFLDRWRSREGRAA